MKTIDDAFNRFLKSREPWSTLLGLGLIVGMSVLFCLVYPFTFLESHEK